MKMNWVQFLVALRSERDKLFEMPEEDKSVASMSCVLTADMVLAGIEKAVRAGIEDEYPRPA